MSYIDERKAEVKTRLEAYRKAELAILEGNQSWVSPDGMTYNRGNLYHVQRAIQNLTAELAWLEGDSSGSGGFSAQTVVFGRPVR